MAIKTTIFKYVDRPETPANQRARTGGSQDQGQAEHTMSSRLAWAT